MNAASATQPAPPRVQKFARLAILHDRARRGGLRVVKVAELERYDTLSASYVMETRRPERCHFVPWPRLGTRRTCGAKLRALLNTRAAALTAA